MDALRSLLHQRHRPFVMVVTALLLATVVGCTTVSTRPDTAARTARQGKVAPTSIFSPIPNNQKEHARPRRSSQPKPKLPPTMHYEYQFESSWKHFRSGMQITYTVSSNKVGPIFEFFEDKENPPWESPLYRVPHLEHLVISVHPLVASPIPGAYATARIYQVTLVTSTRQIVTRQKVAEGNLPLSRQTHAYAQYQVP